MKHLGLTSRVPRISVIQAEGANPLYRSFTPDGPETIEPVVADTRASAIRIGNPASWRKSMRVIRETGGFCEQASEAEIALAKSEIGREGIGCEPASAVTLAGLKKLANAGKVQAQESVVLLLTGHTLKDADYTIEFHRGDLLRPDELTADIMPEILAQRRPARVLEATVKAVLEVLEAAQA
jgi:threonine synthase